MKTNYQVAIEVIGGQWGNGEVRKQRLSAAGYDYEAVQQLVNVIMSADELQAVKPAGKFRKITLDLQKYDGLEVYFK